MTDETPSGPPGSSRAGAETEPRRTARSAGAFSIDPSDSETFLAALDRVDVREKGHYFEAFTEGSTIEHEPGLTLTAWDNRRWMAQTLNHDPSYWRRDVASDRGFEEPPIHPDFLLAATLGPTVEDLSEKGGYFLGRTDVRFPAGDVSPGTPLAVESDVLDARSSGSRPAYGIVTWATRGTDAETGEVLCSYERTNMIPRRRPVETDGAGSPPGIGEDSADERLPNEFLKPEGRHFEDFADALERAGGRDAAVAYRHERGRTMDDVTVASLPLGTLNTAKQHHNADAMADAPSGGIVAYGDVTRSTALGHARSDDRTVREVRFEDERFHTFVTPGDTVYAFTQVLGVDSDAAVAEAGTVRFRHVAFNQREEAVYSGIRTAEIARRGR